MSELEGTSTVAAAENISQPAVNVHEQPAEKMLPQSQVDEIVKRAKSQAVENYKKLYTEQPEYAQKKYGDPAPVHAQHNSFNEDSYRKIAAEEAQRMRDEIFSQAQQRQQEEQAQRIVQKFYQKVSPAQEAYEDFDKVTGDMKLDAFPHTVQILAEHVENSGDLLYELGKDRLKLLQLEQLAQYSPNDAIAQAQRLSNAVKERKEAIAQAAKSPRDPLSRLQPNVNGTTANASDWKTLKRQWSA